jgi:CRP/FNR family cyclic AMP-dependent transcriptional regulator
MPIDPSIVAEIEHLRDLAPAEQAALAERIEMLPYQVGQMIFNYGDPGHALYIVRSGEVEIFVKNDQGEKIVLEVAQPGDVFGEVSLLDDGPRTAWVSAVTDVEVLRLDREHFEDYVRLYTPAALNLLSVIARRLRKSDEMIRRTVTRNANDVTEETKTIGSVIADTVANLAGSIKSVLLHLALFSLYAVVNFGVIRLIKPFDPFPFGLLSDLLGLEAIFLTIFVLSSQNRQRARDQIRSDIEFETNINAELKIANLHEKIDRLTENHYQVFINTQKMLALSEAKRS